jgi:4-hydroxyphenylpyruvate dioxygenase
MADLFDNPAGLDGFEFIEFSAPEKGVLEPVFETMGFVKIAKHRSKDVELWRQGGINLITNYEPNSAAWYFAREHGPSACGMGWRVKDAEAAYKGLLERGAEPVQNEPGPMELYIPGIRGIGNSIIYLIDRYDDGDNSLSIYDIDFEYLPGVDRNPEGCGFNLIDHLTHNVYGGRMAYWADFYEKLFNFQEIRFFDIKGEYTGLTSKALTAPDGKIRIPLNEEGDSGKGQIEEFLREYNGEGIQHIAVGTDDIYDSVDAIAANGLRFMPGPNAAYYEMSKERVIGHEEPLDRMQAHGILIDGEGVVDGGETKILLQIFSKTVIGPIFFEFIQRKGDDGFGEGNFKALFESIEQEQIANGEIAAE